MIFILLACSEHEDSALIHEFRYARVDQVPKISVHRGGKGLTNYPENCLETLDYLHQRIDAVYEIDISQTMDGELVLMHDNSLERTTSGSGLLKKKSYNEISKLNLVDDFDNKTTYKIPLLSEVLQWAVAKDAVLTLDLKKGVPLNRVLSEIKALNAKDHCIIITYSLEEALKVYNEAPQLMMSVSARNRAELERLLKSKIPAKNMIAFTGTRLSDEKLYQNLHDKNILTILGTLGNLDKRAAARGDDLYLEWKALGVDMMATDRPLAVHNVLK